VASEAVQAGLQAVARFTGRVGFANVAAVLGGRQTKWSKAQTWVEQLPFHGSLRGWKEERIKLLLSELIARGFARQSAGEYPVVELTAAGRDTLAQRMVPALTLPAEAKKVGLADVPAEMLERLRRWRLETARTSGVPAYVIFHDSTLNAIAAARPSSLADLLLVSGVGDSKLRKYGEEVLEVVRGSPS
jgi:ATP-dependent DNA helicase RecQ